MFERKMVVFVAMRGERKGGKRKKSFSNSTCIILRGNILCISYNSSLGLESYGSKSKNKKKIGDEVAVGGVFFCVNRNFFGEKLEIT